MPAMKSAFKLSPVSGNQRRKGRKRVRVFMVCTLEMIETHAREQAWVQAHTPAA
jgi:hypothetical protein